MIHINKSDRNSYCNAEHDASLVFINAAMFIGALLYDKTERVYCQTCLSKAQDDINFRISTLIEQEVIDEKQACIDA